MRLDNQGPTWQNSIASLVYTRCKGPVVAVSTFREKEMSLWLECSESNIALCEMREENGQRQEFPDFVRFK